MITNMWIGPAELDQIKVALDILHKAYDEIRTLDNISVDLFENGVGEGTTMPVRDCNGEIIGHFGIGDGGGVALYFDNGEK